MGITGKIESGPFRGHGSVCLPRLKGVPNIPSAIIGRPAGDICPQYAPISIYFPGPDGTPLSNPGPKRITSLCIY